MKYNYFIKVDTYGKYITTTNGSWFNCEDGKKAKKFTISTAKDILYGLVCNFFQAHIEIHPSYFEAENPVRFYIECDGNCQECEYAVWQTENLGESKIVGCGKKSR